MEGEENILEAIYEEVNEEDDDVNMVDVEGEFVDKELNDNLEKTNVSHPSIVDKECMSKNRRRRSNKKKNKKKISGTASNVTDINKFVLDSCKRLKERKSYMVYTAVGCLGISAISDLIKEVDAVQACGGQMTADARRFRTGGGVLWNIIKAREPNAYKEIMKKAKDFEKQFRQANVRKSTGTGEEVETQGPEVVAEASESKSEEKRGPVHQRLRVPVSYDDHLLHG